MAESPFDSAIDRIQYSEAVDFLQQGRAHLVQPTLVELYVRKGLWRRQGDKIELTEEGQRQHQMAVRERFSDG